MVIYMVWVVKDVYALGIMNNSFFMPSNLVLILSNPRVFFFNPLREVLDLI